MKPGRGTVYDIYRKNKDDVKALLLGRYPRSVYLRINELQRGEIPVFVLHSVQPDKFEAQLQYLVENQYRTVMANELGDLVTGAKTAGERIVALTFDDGRGSLWSIAYPLLKKYGLSAISFIVPGQIKQTTTRLPNLEDVWNDRADLQQVCNRENMELLCTWNEIQEMHRSGTIDFQSHTSYHHSVFYTDHFVDFVNPDFKPAFLKGTCYIPVHQGGRDVFPSAPEWGRPIFRWAPAMAVEKRFLEDEDLSQHCMEYVRDNGDLDFFKQRDWRRFLKARFRQYIRRYGRSGHFQTPSERINDLRYDLSCSKEMIEAKLRKQVRHLCYPWYQGSKTAVQISKEVGYRANYWGILGRDTVNWAGRTDPFHLVRINADYIFSLPGKGRQSIHQIIVGKIKVRAKGV